MDQSCYLKVSGSNTHLIVVRQLTSLQGIVAGLGATVYPLFLRLGGSPSARMQPVTGRSLLAELEHMLPRLAETTIPGMLFRDAQGSLLGSLFSEASRDERARQEPPALYITPEGLRVVLGQFPPPAGFRSRPGMNSRHYECFFQRINRVDNGYVGIRTPAMGNTQTPVALPIIPVPRVTHWDKAYVAGQPDIASIEFAQAPASEVYQDALHALETACTDALRLKEPLEILIR